MEGGSAAGAEAPERHPEHRGKVATLRLAPVLPDKHRQLELLLASQAFTRGREARGRVELAAVIASDPGRMDDPGTWARRLRAGSVWRVSTSAQGCGECLLPDHAPPRRATASVWPHGGGSACSFRAAGAQFCGPRRGLAIGHVTSHELVEPRYREVDVPVVLGGVDQSGLQQFLAQRRKRRGG